MGLPEESTAMDLLVGTAVTGQVQNGAATLSNPIPNSTPQYVLNSAITEEAVLPVGTLSPQQTV